MKFQENSELRAPSKCGRIATSYADKQVQEMLQLLAAKQTPDRKQQPPPTKAVGGWGSRRLRYGHEFPPLRFFLQQNWNIKFRFSKNPEDINSISKKFHSNHDKFAFFKKKKACSILSVVRQICISFDQIQMIKQNKVDSVVHRPFCFTGVWRKLRAFCPYSAT